MWQLENYYKIMKHSVDIINFMRTHENICILKNTTRETSLASFPSVFWESWSLENETFFKEMTHFS